MALAPPCTGKFIINHHWKFDTLLLRTNFKSDQYVPKFMHDS